MFPGDCHPGFSIGGEIIVDSQRAAGTNILLVVYPKATDDLMASASRMADFQLGTARSVLCSITAYLLPYLL